MKQFAEQAAVFVAVFAVWGVGVHLGEISESVLPQVDLVLRAGLDLLVTSNFWSLVWLTVRDAATGLVIATIAGVVAGVVIGSTPWLERSTRLIVDFGRSFPQIALLPIFLLLFGATSTMKIVLVAIACFFPVLLQTIYGARRLDETLADTVRAYRIPPLMKLTRVILPAASPFIFTGFRIAVIVSILVAVAVEITSQVQGMGREIAKARDFYRTDLAIAYALYAGVLGVIVNMGADRLERAVLGWHLRMEKE